MVDQMRGYRHLCCRLYKDYATYSLKHHSENSKTWGVLIIQAMCIHNSKTHYIRFMIYFLFLPIFPHEVIYPSFWNNTCGLVMVFCWHSDIFFLLWYNMQKPKWIKNIFEYHCRTCTQKSTWRWCFSWGNIRKHSESCTCLIPSKQRQNCIIDIR